MNKKIIVAPLCLILPIIMLSAMALESEPQVTSVGESLTIEKITFWNVGTNTELESFYSNKSTALNLKVESLDTQSFNEHSAIKESVLKKSSIIMLDGNWLAQNYEKAEIKQFLNETAKNVGAIIVVGNTTSNLYVALDKAGIYEPPRDLNGNLRNPAKDNPIAAGFRLQQIIDSHGKEYYVKGFFTFNSPINSNTTTADLIDNIISFVNHDGRIDG